MKNIKKLSIAILILTLFNGCKLFENWFGKKQETIVAAKESKKEPLSNKIIEIKTEEDFENQVINCKKPVIVKFTAEWCGACKIAEPIYKKAAEKFKNKKFTVVNIDELESVAKKHKILGVPSFLFFKDGKEIEKIVGAVEEKEFFEKIEEVF